MDIFVYDNKFKMVAIVDRYKSFIWTDRFDSYGDFELCTVVSKELLDIFKEDYYLKINDSEHTMVVSDIEIETDVEDGNYLKITGYSLERILERRCIYPQTSFTGNLQDAIVSMLNDNVISPAEEARKIPGVKIVKSSDTRITALTLDAQYTGDDLYSVISTLCQQNNIGFKLIATPSPDGGLNATFELYAGTDRSFSQRSNPYVIFSPDYDNLLSSNYIHSKSDYKNVTLVAGERIDSGTSSGSSGGSSSGGSSGSGGTLVPATRTVLGGVKVGSNLNVTVDGTISVDMASAIEEDNTRPISAAKVYTEIGNINALLKTI